MESSSQTARSAQSSRVVQQKRNNSKNFLRIVYSPGVSPDKWFNRFDDWVHGWHVASAQVDDPMKFLANRQADVGLVRLGKQSVNSDFHEVRLYEEQLGIAAPKEHPVKEFTQVEYADLEGEMRMYQTPADGVVDIDAVREALGVVAANVGIAIAPRPLLRSLNVRGVVHRDLLKQPVEIGQTRVAVVWLKDRDDDVVQDFVGICRGRSQQSSRSTQRRTR